MLVEKLINNKIRKKTNLMQKMNNVKQQINNKYLS